MGKLNEKELKQMLAEEDGQMAIENALRVMQAAAEKMAGMLNAYNCATTNEARSAALIEATRHVTQFVPMNMRVDNLVTATAKLAKLAD